MYRLETALSNLDYNRFVLLFGKGINDSFITRQMRIGDILQSTWLVLKEQGFERIIFTSLDNPIYFLDDHSRDLSQDFLWSIAQTNDQNLNHLQTGPFGASLFLPINNHPISVTTKGIGDTHAIRLLDTIFHEGGKDRTAIIFNQFESFMHLHQDLRTLTSVLSSWLRLPVANPNRAVFITSAGDRKELTDIANRFPVPEFRSIILNESSSRSTKMISRPVDAPGEDEIQRLIERESKDRFLPVTLDDTGKFCGMLASEGVSLNAWIKRLEQVDEISLQNFRQFGWITSTRDIHQSAQHQLMNMVGLDAIKQRISELCSWSQVKQINRPTQEVNLHMIFTGNPGTGKTTVARLIGEIYQDIGILKKGHLIEVKAADLVADYVGGTAIKTNEVIDQALDGILFIDEAYALSEKERGGFGAEALETILMRMENDRSRLVVILAGYREQINRLIRSNPGIDRRFSKDNRFDFPDLTVPQLVEVMEYHLSQKNLVADEEVKDALNQAVEDISRHRRLTSGNAGEIRNLVESLERRCLSRLASRKPNPPYQLILEDIPDSYRAGLHKDLAPIDELFQELNDLVGLEPIKTWMQRQVARIQFEQLRASKNSAHPYRSNLQHLVFVGNPGTGKTTVARLVGKIYQSIGLLRSGHLVEVSMPDLIAGYVGQTAGKVMEQVENAMGGVLFIDEAYALVRSNSFFQGSYGQEAIDTLVKAIEDYRDQLVVILAGYPKEMEILLRANPGLKSRFAPPILFHDFDELQMQQIIETMAEQDGLRLSEPVRHAAIQQLLYIRSQDPGSFGNAREIRSMYERMKDNLAARVVKLAHQTGLANKNMPSEWEEFTLDDITGVEVAVIIQGDSNAPQTQSGLKSWVIDRSQPL